MLTISSKFFLVRQDFSTTLDSMLTRPHASAHCKVTSRVCAAKSKTLPGGGAEPRC